MKTRKNTDPKLYYFIDIDPYSRQIVSWNVETKEQVEVQLRNGCYRVFLSKGQYNKLMAALKEARS